MGAERPWGPHVLRRPFDSELQGFEGPVAVCLLCSSVSRYYQGGIGHLVRPRRLLSGPVSARPRRAAIMHVSLDDLDKDGDSLSDWLPVSPDSLLAPPS